MSALHSIYGLRVQSELPLGPLPPAAGTPDVVVRLGPARALAVRPPRPGCFEVRPGHVFLGTVGGGVVVARHGREVLVDARPMLDRDALASLVLGQGLAAVLHQRGVLSLHASAVALDGGAVAFLGDQGAGKSTLAAAVMARGGAFVTDDVLAVRGLDSGAPRVSAGYPFLKITEATARALGERTDRLAPAYSALAKWKRTAETASTVEPLRAVYALERGPAFAAERLRGVDAFTTVARHAFAGALAGPMGEGARCLRHYTALAEATPVFRLAVPQGLGRLPALADRVVAHAQYAAGPPAPLSPNRAAQGARP